MTSSDVSSGALSVREKSLPQVSTLCAFFAWGGNHCPETCIHCLRFSRQTKKNRVLRLCESLLESALSPSTMADTPLKLVEHHLKSATVSALMTKSATTSALSASTVSASTPQIILPELLEARWVAMMVESADAASMVQSPITTPKPSNLKPLASTSSSMPKAKKSKSHYVSKSGKPKKMIEHAGDSNVRGALPALEAAPSEHLLESLWVQVASTQPSTLLISLASERDSG